ncbi:MAG: coenzyme F420-0:L-glutamate ligase [Actinobacteria bacterium]|nr:MAG: coenzyme F420-0:L-glutamate ligase [Actinomycetota bacterium]
MRFEILSVDDLPEIEPGTDLATLIADRSTVRDGDVVVVTSKIVSKAEGRIVEVDPTDRETARRDWAETEARRIVARRDELLITETSQGFVCANSGVDGSNLPADRLALLPLDPDGSAQRLRDGLKARGADVAIVISDTFGRAWRGGQTNVAIGVAGLKPFRDYRGEKDVFGAVMEATLIAVADEIAGAAELVMGKTDGVPVALVRGIPTNAFGDGSARELIRPPEEDLFRTGGLEGIEGRRSVREFSDRAVTRGTIERAVSAAATAPAPHASRAGRPWRFVWLRTDTPRGRFLAAMEEAWKRDLDHDRTPPDVVEQRLGRSRHLIGEAPVLLACFVSLAGADRYPDAERLLAEREMFLAAAGGAIQNLMLALSAQGVGSCWLSTSLFCSDEAGKELGLGPEWQAVGCVIAGYPPTAPPPREPLDPKPFLDVR